MKRIAVFLTVCVLGTGLSACTEKAEQDMIQGEPVESSVRAPESEEQLPGDASGDAAAEQKEPEAGQTGETAQGETAPLKYEDNFAVDSDAAAAFAQQIKDAVAAQDLEALADLTAFPVYVGFAEGGIGVETREDFVALGAEKIFTPELVENMAGETDKEFSPSMAGFTVSEGRPNITFGVVDGSLGIVGINY